MTDVSPAEKASIEALDSTRSCIDNNECFRLEAGAGAGKTFSLIESIKYLIAQRADELLRREQRIACITYTNVAKDEIKQRTDNHPVIIAETIHGFSWSLLSSHQDKLRELIPGLGDRWKDRIEDAGGINGQLVKYELGFPSINESEITLHHDDIVVLMSQMLAYKKFQNLVKSKFPVIFIDEYQDTDKALAESILTNLIDNDSGILIGLFGDHWQKIYGSSACGLITSNEGKIKEIGKKANFRSDKNIVKCLNQMRPDLPQFESDPHSQGVVKVFHSNSWVGERQGGAHWKGDLPSDVSKQYVEKARELMIADGWDFSSENTKVLLLTNNLIAEEQSFKALADCYRYPDDYLKKSDKYIAYFLDVIEPAVLAFDRKAYGELFLFSRNKFPRLRCQQDKKEWSKSYQGLLAIRNDGTVGDILDYIMESTVLKLPDKVNSSEWKFHQLIAKPKEELSPDEASFVNKLNKLRSIKYSEVVNLGLYIDDKTPFSTKHGVKGAQFDNVLVVCGRGWNHYNWNQMLEWFMSEVPSDKQGTYERNRNLFYVSCSRAKHNLTLLFTQELSAESLQVLEGIFDKENVLGSPFDA
ncbi:TPA: ATP-dependent helicase [Vibrio harveyi]|uniref:UvrD-helicase domain-containing protein n=1 Tax=Vibrio harveyi TaxID=669 RepID=UPI00211A80C5|nr:UvrD-helicase domain-containing protein [Vibrio harveyi]MCQ9075967.1 ATP-dependent helicase [Vibrio harveyi]HDM8190572.1 ATP-dependent helicase [Vibrio harveyi]